MRTVFQLVQDFHKEARGEGFSIKWGPARGEFGALEFPADIVAENIKHIAQTKLSAEGTSIQDIHRAVELLSDQAERAGASFNPGFILAQVDDTMVELYGGIPLEWIAALELLIHPSIEWVGMHGSRRLDINVRGDLDQVIAVGEQLGFVLGDAWTVNIVYRERKIQCRDEQISTQFLADARALIEHADEAIAPFHIHELSNDKIIMSGFTDYSLAGDAITYAGKLAAVARPFPHWKENIIPTLEIAMYYEPVPMAELWQGNTSKQAEPFDEFERLVREEVMEHEF